MAHRDAIVFDGLPVGMRHGSLRPLGAGEFEFVPNPRDDFELQNLDVDDEVLKGPAQ